MFGNEGGAAPSLHSPIVVQSKHHKQIPWDRMLSRYRQTVVPVPSDGTLPTYRPRVHSIPDI